MAKFTYRHLWSYRVPCQIELCSGARVPKGTQLRLAVVTGPIEWHTEEGDRPKAYWLEAKDDAYFTSSVGYFPDTGSDFEMVSGNPPLPYTERRVVVEVQVQRLSGEICWERADHELAEFIVVEYLSLCVK